MRASRLLVALALAGAVTSCALIRANGDPTLPVAAEWLRTRAQAAQEVTALRYGIADRMLMDFAMRYPSTAEATDATYWRAFFKLDPANGSGSMREAEALLDTLLSTRLDSTRRADAMALRRMATSLERSLTATTGAAQPTTGSAARPDDKSAAAAKPDDKARDDEIQRLKDELAKANAELERIRRRLAQPKP